MLKICKELGLCTPQTFIESEKGDNGFTWNGDSLPNVDPIVYDYIIDKQRQRVVLLISGLTMGLSRNPNPPTHTLGNPYKK